MEQNEETRGNASFGAYLKKVREGRRLSLDAVEELSAAFPEKVTKSHLSRIENGLALPTFPRLMAMGHIYGVPIASLAERYEIELRRGMASTDLADESDEQILADADERFLRGEIVEALGILWKLFERRDEQSFSARLRDQHSFPIRVRIINFLCKSGRYEYAKSLAEETLSAHGISPGQRLILLQYLAMTCYRLQRYTLAALAVDECERGISEAKSQAAFHADTLALKANILMALGQPDAAVPVYRDAAAKYAELENSYENMSVRINLADALAESGHVDDARSTVSAALIELEPTLFDRLRAIALTVWAKLEWKSKRFDDAERLATKSNLIARRLEHSGLVFKNCFYLWRIAQAREDLAAVRLNERTLKTYLARIEGGDPETEEFRQLVTREDS